MGSLELLIVGSNNKPTGGIQRYIPNQLEHIPDDISASVYDIGAPGGSGPLWFLKVTLLALLDAAKFPLRSRPDVAHVHTSHAFSFFRSSFYVLFISYIWRRPVVLHIHGSAFDEFAETDSRLLSFYQSIVFSATSRVIILGDYWYEEMSQYIDEQKLVIIPNAVAPEKYDPTFGSGTPSIVFISDLMARKGVYEIIEAIDGINESSDFDFTVELGGLGSLSNEFQSLANRHANVTYHGYVSEEKKRELLNEGIIYLLPSYAEGLPIAMLEAMAGGNAIISTNVGSIPEVINEENGIIINPGDANALKKAIRSLLEDPEKVVQMARANRVLVSEKYSWDEVMEQLVECYEELNAAN